MPPPKPKPRICKRCGKEKNFTFHPRKDDPERGLWVAKCETCPSPANPYMKTKKPPVADKPPEKKGHWLDEYL